MKRILPVLLTALLAAVPALGQTPHRLLPARCMVGVEVSYDGEPRVAQTISDYQNLFFSGFALTQHVKADGDACIWEIHVKNDTPRATIEVGSLWFSLSGPEVEKGSAANMGFQSHPCIAGNASYIYWCRYLGTGDGLLMTTADHTSLEYVTVPDFNVKENRYHILGKWAARADDTWRMPLTSITLAPREEKVYTFRFEHIDSIHGLDHRIAQLGGLTMRVAPGMVIPVGKEVLCAVDCPRGINAVTPQFPRKTSVRQTEGNGKTLLAFTFSKRGENQVVVDYGDGDKAYLEFFVTEPFDELIRTRSAFITRNQQVRDVTKWYDGLYSLWDMETCQLMTPDNQWHLCDFQVGGSDDPSNSKPFYVSEKNVFWPDRDEVRALEYYEDHFVYGKLQRTGDEHPYPWGIYGSENWYQNRSGDCGGMDSGGWGQQRLWRTFDYVTHIAIYYNLYLIASANPSLTENPASHWLDMAYHTTMAFFTVPYNIYMQRFAFNGWCDWAYKQGNFHERYILDLMDALDENGRTEQAAEIRHEWEKKVLYFMYDDPWPFASEYDIDRTAYESSYYIADYGCRHRIEPRQNLWQDKNSGKWYSYSSYSPTDALPLLQNQLASNYALRGIYGLSYWRLGTAWTQTYCLDYMTQMGGAAILDYAFRYSPDVARDVNYGYNSLCASWALVNTGYWNKRRANRGAAGWQYVDAQNAWMASYEMISARRGPYRFDGEIDHGFAGGVHAAGTYVVDDPDFGIYAYGGTIVPEDGRCINVVPNDGVCRRVFFTTPCRIGVELRQDAFAPRTAVTLTPSATSADGNHLTFTITNRYHTPHDCHARLWAMTGGCWQVKADGVLCGSYHTDDLYADLDISFPLGGRDVLVEVTYIPDGAPEK